MLAPSTPMRSFVQLVLCILACCAPAQAIEKQGGEQVKALVAQGHGLCQRKLYEQAEPVFRKALLVDAKSVPALLGLAEIYKHQGKPDKSFNCLETAVRLEPQNADCYIEEAKFFQSIDRPSAAIEASKKALAIAPNNAEAYYRLGFYQRLGGDNQAEKNLKHALQLDPRHDSACRQLAYLCWDQKRYGEARSCFQSAIKLAPDNQGYYKDLAALLKAEGKKKEARAVCVAMEKTFPKSSSPYLGLADMAQADGNRKEQEEFLRQATLVQPTSSTAWRLLAIFYSMDKKFPESMKCARIAYGFKPREVKNASVLAVCLMESDKPKEAEGYWQKTVELAQPGEEKRWYQGALARVQLILGKNEEALGLARLIYKQAPDEPRSITTLAFVLTGLKHYDEALALLKQAKAKRPGDGSFDYEYLQALMSAGRYEQARSLAKQVLTQYARNGVAWSCLMDIARKTHNKKEADEAMKHLNGVKFSADESMEFGFSGITLGQGNNALPALKKALEASPESADIILNARDPKEDSAPTPASGAANTNAKSNR
jgi:tetratricopeptide (TPR) repeat protein